MTVVFDIISIIGLDKDEGIELKEISHNVVDVCYLFIVQNEEHGHDLDISKSQVISVTDSSLEDPVENEDEDSNGCCTIDRPFPILGFLKRYVLIVVIIPSYKKEFFYSDFIAGISVGIVTIPQGMSNSMLTNIPPVYGLYGSIVPPFVFACLTTSPHIHIGPYAICIFLSFYLIQCQFYYHHLLLSLITKQIRKNTQVLS